LTNGFIYNNFGEKTILKQNIMKPILFKTGLILTITLAISLIYLILNLNISNQVSKLAKRVQFEEFLNTQLAWIWSTSNLYENDPTLLHENSEPANVSLDMLQARGEDNIDLASDHDRGLSKSTHNYCPSTSIASNTYKKSNNFPNPTSDKLHFISKVSSVEQTPIKIFDSSDSLAKTLLISQNNSVVSTSIDITELKTGIYLIIANIGGEIFTTKVIKNYHNIKKRKNTTLTF